MQTATLTTEDLLAEVVSLKAALQSSEEFVRRQYDMLDALFVKSPAAIALLRLDNGCFVDVNAQWKQLIGYDWKTVVGHSPLKIGMWHDEAACDAALDYLTHADGDRKLEITFTTEDKRSLVLQLQGSPMSIAGDAHAVVYFSDITAKREAQRAVEASEKALQNANEDLRSQLELYDLTESLGRVGHWTLAQGFNEPEWSTALKSLTFPEQGSLSLSEAVGRIHEDDRASILQAMTNMDGKLVEYRWNRFDNQTRWLRSRMHRHFKRDGSYVDFGVIQDFTDEQLAKEALEDKLQMVQHLTSRLPQMLFQFTKHGKRSGVFAFVSDASETIFGVSAAAALKDPNSIFNCIYPEDKEATFKAMTESALHGTTWAHEFRVVGSDGICKTVFGKAITLLEQSGHYVAYGSITDITDHKASQAVLRESEARFRALTELSSDWYWEQDDTLRFVRLDGLTMQASELLGVSVLGKALYQLGALNRTVAHWNEHRKLVDARLPFKDLELQFARDKDQHVWVSLSGAPFLDDDGNFKGYRGVGRDITGRKKAEAKIERLAFYDALTGLPNRRLLLDRLQKALVGTHREKSFGALIFIDLDNFKDLNDTQGHDMGDVLLRQVAQRLVSNVRACDTVARLGGDEFVVMLLDLGHSRELASERVHRVGKKIKDHLNQVYLLGTLEHHSTPSMGVTIFEDRDQTVDDLLKRADLAMYEAKNAGRNALRFFDPIMQAQVAKRTALEADLRQGIVRNELVLHYQPVVNPEARMVGVEALVRWQHPRRGMVSPIEFIPVAEQTSLILPLGHWVLQAACKQLAAWAQQPTLEPLTIAVNVSARQFRHPDFVHQVMALFEETGANPHRLKIELTESLLLTDTQDTTRKMTELQAAGVSFSLDDFGTGYSSLSYLKVLPLQQLKIDQSFVRDVLTDPNDAAIARTVLALGQSLGYHVVAEGVETEGQREFLLDNGCNLFQGYLFGRPVPVQDLRLETVQTH